MFCQLKTRFVIRKRQSELRLNKWLPAEFTGLRVVARGTPADARFIDIEACTFRIFDAIRERFAIRPGWL